MSISKAVGVVTAGIPIVGILIGGITFGLNFKTDVENIKEDVANQQTVNADMEERFSALNVAPYDDTLLWLQADAIHERLDNIHIPDGYDDSYLDDRIQNLALQITALRTELDGLDIQDMETFDDSDLRGRLAELEGQLNALSNIDMTSDDGSVDLGPLVVRIASAEGSIDSLKSSITTLKSDMRTIKSDITAVERVANSAKSTADSAKSNSGGSRTVENDYDDSNLRSRISAVERQVNAIPTTSSSGTTIQRVENPFDDASLRSDISALQTAVAVLQATGDNSYDDSSLRNMIDDIQWDLANLDIPTTPDTVDTSWLEDLMYDIKNELSMRIDQLEWASDTTTTSDDMYAEKWRLEDLQSEVMFVQEQVWELQTLITTANNNNTTSSSSSSSSTSSNTMVGRNWDGNWTEPVHIYVKHLDGNGNHTYTGDYWMDGYYDTYPVWVNWECGTGQWQTCYIYKYNHTSWVLQPVEPTDQWQANSYNDNGVWPWEGSWAGDVEHVELIN